MKARSLLIALLLLAAACTDAVELTTDPSEPPSTEAVSATEPATTSTATEEPVVVTSSATATVLGDAPWAGAPLAEGEVPSVLGGQWSMAENRLWCSALAPVDLGAEGAQGTPRAANFGGGWAVAWDKPDGPGSASTGGFCPDCGRSAFGIAGAGVLTEPDTAIRMPTVLEWSDGSTAGYANEGLDSSNPKLLAEISVEGQGCVYQVWSHLGAAHLESLISSLRFVDGLQAEPVILRDRGSPPQVIDGGPAPWTQPPLPLAQVPTLLLEEWEKAAAANDVPLVAFADLGTELEEAQIRTANVASWGVAWDNPSGPGHDGLNQPCIDCGRGVIGLGAYHEIRNTLSIDPYRIEWDDGSYAEYGRRLADSRLPWDRIIFNDPATGQPTQDALEARVVIPGFNAELIVWSHLGEQHLLHLLDTLRLVDVNSP